MQNAVETTWFLPTTYYDLKFSQWPITTKLYPKETVEFKTGRLSSPQTNLPEIVSSFEQVKGTLLYRGFQTSTFITIMYSIYQTFNTDLV